MSEQLPLLDEQASTKRGKPNDKYIPRDDPIIKAGGSSNSKTRVDDVSQEMTYKPMNKVGAQRTSRKAQKLKLLPDEASFRED